MSLAPQSTGIAGFPADSPEERAPEGTENQGDILRAGTIAGADVSPLIVFGHTPAGQPFESDGATVRIRVKSGEWFSISAGDFERVTTHCWGLARWKKHPEKLYVKRTIRSTETGKKATLSLHRFLVDAQPGDFVDHQNGSTLDNTRGNLRICTPRENTTNVTSSKNQKRGGYKGVGWNKNANKWEAYISGGEIKADGRRRRLYLGLFVDPKVAAHRYDAAAIKHFGAFAALNFEEDREDLVALTAALVEDAERATVVESLLVDPPRSGYDMDDGRNG
jgi:hypothetical protein